MNFDNPAPRLTLGYDLDSWKLYREKMHITIDLSPKTNSHILLCGMSGSGKSYLEQQILCKLALAEPDGEIHFADYKGDDPFQYLENCPRYYFFKDTLKALDTVHGRLLARQSGEDTSRNPVTLIWDEYMAQVLALTSEDKKAAAVVMGKVSEILMLGRSLSVRLIISCQRPDALAFPAGSRLNVGSIILVGAYIRSIYEMLLPDHMDLVKGRQFGRGEGVVLFQGSELHFIKVGAVSDTHRMEEICIKALGGKT
ncbi:MAG: hypothetical protein K2M42_02085 [Oscillospiraceae bacterium]|nr:hypothetical protein [Oscillospiraceae bacterium]